jgi:hypothetical protein
VSSWTANITALWLAWAFATILALGLLWRIGSWQIHPAETLTFDEGLPIGSPAEQLAAYTGDHEIHLSFDGGPVFLVFGNGPCEPCKQLLRSAAVHPATRHMRLVSLSDDDELDVPLETLRHWESYRFHDETQARKHWRAPVSPYFHVIDEFGRIAAKGIANRPEHLDRLLQLAPTPVRVQTLQQFNQTSNSGGMSSD